jgi:hypothetical protein
MGVRLNHEAFRTQETTNERKGTLHSTFLLLSTSRAHADLLIVLTIVHFDGTSILSPYTIVLATQLHVALTYCIVLGLVFIIAFYFTYCYGLDTDHH